MRAVVLLLVVASWSAAADPAVLGQDFLDGLARDVAAWKRAKELARRDKTRLAEAERLRLAVKARHDALALPAKVEWRLSVAAVGKGWIRVEPLQDLGIVLVPRVDLPPADAGGVLKGDAVVLRATASAGKPAASPATGYRTTVRLTDARIAKPRE